MKIELLYFDGCPSWQTALKNLSSVLREEGITETVNVMEIMNDEHDLWFEERENYSLSCRVYATPEGVKGYPTVEMLRSKIKSAVTA